MESLRDRKVGHGHHTSWKGTACPLQSPPEGGRWGSGRGSLTHPAEGSPLGAPPPISPLLRAKPRKLQGGGLAVPTNPRTNTPQRSGARPPRSRRRSDSPRAGGSPHPTGRAEGGSPSAWGPWGQCPHLRMLIPLPCPGKGARGMGRTGCAAWPRQPAAALRQRAAAVRSSRGNCCRSPRPPARGRWCG